MDTLENALDNKENDISKPVIKNKDGTNNIAIGRSLEKDMTMVSPGASQHTECHNGGEIELRVGCADVAWVAMWSVWCSANIKMKQLVCHKIVPTNQKKWSTIKRRSAKPIGGSSEEDPNNWCNGVVLLSVQNVTQWVQCWFHKQWFLVWVKCETCHWTIIGALLKNKTMDAILNMTFCFFGEERVDFVIEQQKCFYKTNPNFHLFPCCARTHKQNTRNDKHTLKPQMQCFNQAKNNEKKTCTNNRSTKNTATPWERCIINMQPCKTQDVTHLRFRQGRQGTSPT